MEHDLTFLRELVEIDTNVVDRKGYTEMAALLKERLHAIGAKVRIVNAKADDGKPRPNVIGYIDNGENETLSINAHYDVVPVVGQVWKHDPFTLRVVDDRAFGRGTNDDKGNIVASYLAAAAAKAEVNIELIYGCDEEVGSVHGIGWVMHHHRKDIKGDNAIVLDSSMSIIVACSGVALGTIKVKGKETHAGYPFLGKNAIAISLPFLEKIQRFDGKAAHHVSIYHGPYRRKIEGRFNLTVLNSGFKENIIPGELTAKFDLRSPPGMHIDRLAEEFKDYFNECRSKSGLDASIEFTTLHGGYETKPSTRIVQKLMKASGDTKAIAAYGGDDGIYFSRAGIPVVAYGCGNESRHLTNEYVSIRQMRHVRDTLIRLLEDF